MKVRCPYCAARFAPPDGPWRCPACGRVALPPGGGRLPCQPPSPAEVRRARLERRRNGNGTVRLPFGAGAWRLLVVAAVLMGAGMLLVRAARRPAPSSLAHERKITADNLYVLAVALNRLAADTGNLPENGDGLAALVHDPGRPGWRGPYILELKPDPWGRRFRYTRHDREANICSDGPDGIPETADDLVQDTAHAPLTESGVYRVRLDAPPP